MSEQPPIYPSFGSMGYWHLAITEIRGPIEDRAKCLLTLIQNGPANVQKWKLQPIQIKAMALELAAASALQGKPLCPDLLHLLAWSMGLDKTSFLYDPSEILAGRDGKGQGAKPETREAREAAELFDWIAIRKTGEQMSTKALAKKVGASRSSVSEWAKKWGWRK